MNSGELLRLQDEFTFFIDILVFSIRFLWQKEKKIYSRCYSHFNLRFLKNFVIQVITNSLLIFQF